MQNFSDLVQGNIFKFRVILTKIGKIAFSTENWPYYGNGERYGQGYY